MTIENFLLGMGFGACVILFLMLCHRILTSSLKIKRLFKLESEYDAQIEHIYNQIQRHTDWCNQRYLDLSISKMDAPQKRVRRR